MNPRSIPTAIRPSGCPGLLRIVPALDGGICRIKLAGGAINADQARAVALAAEQYAGGVIEATNRANLQIRGIGEQQTALIDGLLAAGLGPTSAAGDDVRNLMLSPSAGIDSDQVVDTRPLAEQILATLQSHPRFHELSAKFAVQLDGGETLMMTEHHHDLWLSAFEREGDVLLAFGLAGNLGADALGAVPLARGLDLVVAVLELFLDLATPEQTRMRHLLATVPLPQFIERLVPRITPPMQPVSGWVRREAGQLLHIGTHSQRQTGRVYVGAAAPLGRLNSVQMRGVAGLADELGDGTLRLTPWQSLLLPNVKAGDAETVSQRLIALGLPCSADDALAQLIACTGSSGCGKSLAATKEDGHQLADLLQRHGRSLAVHLSGCIRSCAAARVAPVTLLAVGDNRYDLYFRDAAEPGFGRLHARDLTIEAAGALLLARQRSNTDD